MAVLKKPRRPRPHLTWPLVAYGLIDAAGMVLLAIGGFYFSAGPGAIFKTFPSTAGEAAAAIALGLAVMLWAAARILREVIEQPHMLQQDNDRS